MVDLQTVFDLVVTLELRRRGYTIYGIEQAHRSLSRFDLTEASPTAVADWLDHNYPDRS